MTGSLAPAGHLAGVLAAVAIVVTAGSAPARAQDAVSDPALDGPACAPGRLAEGTYIARSGQADGIIRAEIVHQCERMLDDGTYVPAGYRVRLSEACGAGECTLPFLFATEARNGNYVGRFDNDGVPTQARLRGNRAGALTLSLTASGGRRQERDRARYTLSLAR